MEVLVFLVFGVVLIGFLVNIVRGVSRWSANNKAPQLTVEARVAAKREDTTHHTHTDANGHSHTTHSTTHYVSFAVQSGDRMEFCVHYREYKQLAEGQSGRLTFQGTRYLGFEHVPQISF